jgi:hypothetical protein
MFLKPNLVEKYKILSLARKLFLWSSKYGIRRRTGFDKKTVQIAKLTQRHGFGACLYIRLRVHNCGISELRAESDERVVSVGRSAPPPSKNVWCCEAGCKLIKGADGAQFIAEFDGNFVYVVSRGYPSSAERRAALYMYFH